MQERTRSDATDATAGFQPYIPGQKTAKALELPELKLHHPRSPSDNTRNQQVGCPHRRWPADCCTLASSLRFCCHLSPAEGPCGALLRFATTAGTAGITVRTTLAPKDQLLLSGTGPNTGLGRAQQGGGGGGGGGQPQRTRPPHQPASPPRSASPADSSDTTPTRAPKRRATGLARTSSTKKASNDLFLDSTIPAAS